MSHYYVKDGDKSVRFKPTKKDGEPYQVISKKLADEHGAVKGVTDILKLVGDKTGLMEWYGRIGIEAGIEQGIKIAISAGNDYSEINNLLKETIDKSSECYENFTRKKNKAADEGVELHEKISDMIRRGSFESCDGFHSVISSNAPGWENSPDFLLEHCVVNNALKKYSYGGTIDYIVSIQSEPDEKHVCIFDWKTTRTPRNPSIIDCAQLAAYAKALSVDNDPDFVHLREAGCSNFKIVCVNVYLDQQSFSVYNSKCWTPKELKKGLHLFYLACKVNNIISEKIE